MTTAHWDAPQRKRGRAGVAQRERRLTAHPLCASCLERGLICASDEIDHIVPLAMGGSDSDDNVQGLCRDCHAHKTATEDVSHGAASNHPVWLKSSAIPLTIVCGPPASGKTTYLEKNAQPGDIRIDLDTIIRSIEPTYTHWTANKTDGSLLTRAVRMRNSQLGSLCRRTEGRAWFIVAAPTEAERSWWQERLGGKVELLHPGVDECKRRAVARGTPMAVHGIDEWQRKSVLPWFAPTIKGSDISGRPIDPHHPWNRGPA